MEAKKKKRTNHQDLHLKYAADQSESRSCPKVEEEVAEDEDERTLTLKKNMTCNHKQSVNWANQHVPECLHESRTRALQSQLDLNTWNASVLLRYTDHSTCLHAAAGNWTRAATARNQYTTDNQTNNWQKWRCCRFVGFKSKERSSYTDKSSSLRDRAMTELVLTLGGEYMSGLFLTV